MLLILKNPNEFSNRIILYLNKIMFTKPQTQQIITLNATDLLNFPALQGSPEDQFPHDLIFSKTKLTHSPTEQQSSFPEDHQRTVKFEEKLSVPLPKPLNTLIEKHYYQRLCALLLKPIISQLLCFNIGKNNADNPIKKHANITRKNDKYYFETHCDIECFTNIDTSKKYRFPVSISCDFEITDDGFKLQTPITISGEARHFYYYLLMKDKQAVQLALTTYDQTNGNTEAIQLALITYNETRDKNISLELAIADQELKDTINTLKNTIQQKQPSKNKHPILEKTQQMATAMPCIQSEYHTHASPQMRIEHFRKFTETLSNLNSALTTSEKDKTKISKASKKASKRRLQCQLNDLTKTVEEAPKQIQKSINWLKFKKAALFCAGTLAMLGSIATIALTFGASTPISCAGIAGGLSLMGCSTVPFVKGAATTTKIADDTPKQHDASKFFTKASNNLFSFFPSITTPKTPPSPLHESSSTSTTPTTA